MDNDEADGRDALLEEGPYAVLNSKDVLARMAFWIKIMGSDNGKVDTSICPAVQLAIIFDCGAALTTGLASKLNDRHLPMAQNYKKLVMKMFTNHMISQEQIDSHFKSIKGVHGSVSKNKQQVLVSVEIVGWPSGTHLYNKYDSQKKKIMNEVMIYCPEEVKDISKLPSGQGLLKFIKI
jgi:uncharacterized protein YeaC (DUF1315 family)